MLNRVFIALITVVVQQCYAFKTELVTSAMLSGDITYTTYKSPDFPLVAHVITAPFKGVDLRLQLAQGQREEVSSIAKRTEAFIAVNGCNYRRGGRYNGNRLNLLCTNKKIHTDLQLLRGSLAWNNTSKSAAIAPISLKATLTINDTLLPIDSINQPRNPGQSVLYNDLADVKLLGNTPGLNVIINNHRVVEDVTHTLPQNIPHGWHVYQTDDSVIMSSFAAALADEQGEYVQLDFTLQINNKQMSDEYDFVIGGAGLLIQGGHIVTDKLYDEFSQGKAIVHCHDEVAADFHTKQMQEWLIELRHPRTAVGITESNELCLVVVDGRQAASEGLSLHELAQFMKNLGCVNALNIGGGGCTTLYLDGAVVNSPSANEERPVSEALCLYLPAAS
jgi:hypothetical protein